MRVQNMVSRNGNKIANQFLLQDEDVEVFQSYDSIIVKQVGSTVFLDEKTWNYSKTTSKYRSIFLGESTKETQAKIDSGEYTLCNLNN